MAVSLGANNPQVTNSLQHWGIDPTSTGKNILSQTEIENRLISDKKIRAVTIENRENGSQYYKIRTQNDSTIYVPTMNILLDKTVESLSAVIYQFNELFSKRIINSGIFYYNDTNPNNKKKDIAVLYKDKIG